MMDNFRGPTSGEVQRQVEIIALRELVQELKGRIEAAQGLAQRARYALLDHDVELVRMLLGQIERV